MHVIDGSRARQNFRDNKYGQWNRGADSQVRSPSSGDASGRIFDGFAKVRPRYSGPRLRRTDPVFAMGSCFAREIESRLIDVGATVCSLDHSLDRAEFTDRSGRVRHGFLHRYTPASMLQEFRAAFGLLPEWSEDALIFPRRRGLFGGGGAVFDLNYAFPPGLDYSLEAARTRRGIAHALVRNAATARLIILTLGLTESWLHRPSGLYVNAIAPAVLAAAPEAFELHIPTAAEVEACLEEIYAVLRRSQAGDGFDFVVTVSPVPMSATFTAQDVVVANMDSKSTLRAAAGAFAGRRKNTHYFPSYEMALYSDPALSWQPDRIHVRPDLVKKIVGAFTRSYYEDGAF
jgi:hypothetical protein